MYVGPLFIVYKVGKCAESSSGGTVSTRFARHMTLETLSRVSVVRQLYHSNGACELNICRRHGIGSRTCLFRVLLLRQQLNDH